MLPAEWRYGYGLQRILDHSISIWLIRSFHTLPLQSNNFEHWSLWQNEPGCSTTGFFLDLKCVSWWLEFIPTMRYSAEDRRQDRCPDKIIQKRWWCDAFMTSCSGEWSGTYRTAGSITAHSGDCSSTIFRLARLSWRLPALSTKISLKLTKLPLIGTR